MEIRKGNERENGLNDEEEEEEKGELDDEEEERGQEGYHARFEELGEILSFVLAFDMFGHASIIQSDSFVS